MSKENFSTDDLPLVAFLRLHDYNLIEIQHEDGGRAQFIVQDDGRRRSLMLRFFSKKTLVEPLKFLDEIRTLKALIKQA